MSSEMSGKRTKNKSKHKPSNILLSIFWFIKVLLLLMLVAGVGLCAWDMYVMFQGEDAKGKNHKVVVILTFAITLIFQLLLIVMVAIDELCGLIFVACCRIFILAYQVFSESSYVSLPTFIVDGITVTLILVFSLLLFLAK